MVAGGVAGVLSEGDFLPQTESVVAAKITANAVARERGPNLIHTSNRRAAPGGPRNPGGYHSRPARRQEKLTPGTWLAPRPGGFT